MFLEGASGCVWCESSVAPTQSVTFFEGGECLSASMDVGPSPAGAPSLLSALTRQGFRRQAVAKVRWLDRGWWVLRVAVARDFPQVGRLCWRSSIIRSNRCLSALAASASFSGSSSSLRLRLGCPRQVPCPYPRLPAPNRRRMTNKMMRISVKPGLTAPTHHSRGAANCQLRAQQMMARLERIIILSRYQVIILGISSGLLCPLLLPLASPRQARWRSRSCARRRWRGLPLHEGSRQCQPSLCWWLFSNFGASKICPSFSNGFAFDGSKPRSSVGRFFPELQPRGERLPSRERYSGNRLRIHASEQTRGFHLLKHPFSIARTSTWPATPHVWGRSIESSTARPLSLARGAPSCRSGDGRDAARQRRQHLQTKSHRELTRGFTVVQDYNTESKSFGFQYFAATREAANPFSSLRKRSLHLRQRDHRSALRPA